MKKAKEKKDKLISLAEQISDDYKLIHSYYRNGRLEDLADFLEKRKAVIITSSYKMVRGRCSLEFWEKARQQGAQLELKTANIFLSDRIGTKRVGEKTFDSLSVVVHEVHLIEKKGSSVKNQTAYMIILGPHQDICPWYDNGR